MDEVAELDRLRVKFTATDRRIIDAYHSVVDGIALLMGEHCEVSLHALEDPRSALVKIVNGHHTNRQPGAPLTEHAARVLLKYHRDRQSAQTCTTTTSSSGEPMRSVFVVITNGRKVIGLLNASFNMAIPLAAFISTFSLYQGAERGAAQPAPQTGDNAVEDLVENSLAEVIKEVGADARIANHEKNKYIVRGLQQRGVFDIKGAVQQVSSHLQLSKFTVYSYLREFRAESEQAVPGKD